jgi:hypothetical protein
VDHPSPRPAHLIRTVILHNLHVIGGNLIPEVTLKRLP